MNVKLFGLVGAILLSSPVYAEEGHSHGHADHTAPRAQAKAGKKFETDEVLKTGMEGIRQAMLARRAEIDEDKLSGEDYRHLADVLDQNTTRIVQNCKLSKDTDRAFHAIVLADLMRDTALMRTSPKKQIQRISALGVLQTLRHYGENFQHPGWSLESAPASQRP
ncbi:MAG: hypothetical protein ACM3VZ_11155 [Acidobacteriota bacterium]